VAAEEEEQILPYDKNMLLLKIGRKLSRKIGNIFKYGYAFNNAVIKTCAMFTYREKSVIYSNTAMRSIML
jgi:hypothetical protein